MPFVLYLLGLAVFAQATSEFMLSGLGPALARDLDVSIPATGWLTSAFAIGMIVGAPAVAVLGHRWPRRPALLGTLGLFLIVHVVGALTDSFAVLLVTRVLAAFANAGFLALALATATSLVKPDAKAKATAVLLGGTTLACIAGVPGGALLGQGLGWRAAFWAVALISLPAGSRSSGSFLSCQSAGWRGRDCGSIGTWSFGWLLARSSTAPRSAVSSTSLRSSPRSRVSLITGFR